MKILWSLPARNDFIQAIDFIRNENPHSAKRLAEEIYNATYKIADFPGIGKPGKLEDTREFTVFSTRYIIVYRVQENTVEMLGLLHHKQQWP